jgi:hypothetical protein
MPSSQAAAAPASAAPSGANAGFDTIADTGMTPPDGSLAAGPKQLLAAANSVVQARTLAGTALLTVPIRSFWGFKDTDPVDIVHPRVAYDAGTGHFYFASNLVVHVPVQEDVNGQTETVIIDVTAVLLAVSVGPDLASGWYGYAFLTSRGKGVPGLPIHLELPVGPPVDISWAPLERSDMTALGYDGTALYLSFDMINIESGTPAGNRTLILDKKVATGGGKLNAIMIDDLLLPKPVLPVGLPLNPDRWASGLKPVESGPASSPGMILSYDPPNGVVLYKIGSPLTSPAVTVSTLSVLPYLPPPPAPQSTSQTLLSQGDSSLQKTVYRDGVIWTCHTVVHSFAGAPAGVGQVNVYRINPAGAGSVLQAASLADPTIHFSHPAVLPDNYGSAVAIFEGAGPLNLPSVFSARYDRKTGQFELPQVVAASDFTYEQGGNTHVAPWGAYTDASLDVVTGTNAWIQGELTASPTTWKLRASNQVATPPPAAPSNLGARAVSYALVSLAWRDNSDGEQGFRLERKTGTGAYSQIAVLPANTTTYNDSTVAGGATYTYRLRAYIGGAISGYSNEAAVTTPPPPPAAPASLKATVVSTSEIDLQWTDKSTTEDGFRIERKIGTGSYALLASLGPNVAAYKNTGLKAGTLYTYRVFAYNKAGNSPYSNEAGGTPPTLPAAPTGLAAAPAAGKVTLTWKDGSTNEDLFSIERMTTGAAFAEIATTKANATSYTDAAVRPSTTYTYRVRAKNLAGYSAYSNTAAATVPAPPAAPSGLVATRSASGGSGVTLTWKDNSNNESGFSIERANYSPGAPGTYQEIGTVRAGVVTFTDPAGYPGYSSYRVRAFNAGGYSAYSNTVQAQ